MKKQNTPELEPFNEEKYLAAKGEEAAAAESAKQERARILMEGLKPLNDDIAIEPVVDGGTHIDVDSVSDTSTVEVHAGEWVNTDRPTLPGRNEFIDD